MTFSSCEKDNKSRSYDSSKITVFVVGTTSNDAYVAIGAEDVKDLGVFILGICYSTNTNPTVLNDHMELIVDSDTLEDSDLELLFIVPDLTKSTDYNLKGYLKKDGDIYYSSNQSFKTAGNSLIVDVAFNYIPQTSEYWMVISDNSTTLVTQKLENNQYYIFSNNIPDKVDFHLFKWNSTTNRLYVESYTDITPGEFYLMNPYSSYSAGLVGVTISDLSDFLSWGVAGSWWWNTTTNPETKALQTGIWNNPDNLFINFIPSDGSAPKYKVVSNVTPSSNYTYTMADFSSMTDYVNIPLPDNLFFNYTLAGYNFDYYTEFKKFHGYSYSSGYPGTFKLYYPSGVNSNYYIYAFYNTANQQSFYNKLGSMPTTFFTAFPTITINNSSQFITTTSAINNYSTYEVMDFCGYYSSGGTIVQWDYYKQPQESNSVQIPEFPADVKLKIKNIETKDLSFSDVGYFDIINSPVTSYETYVDMLVKESWRFYDVIKERRYYFQWVNKGSFDKTIKNYDMQGPPDK